jgi:NAD(P) transhydrogenase subunit beta
MSILTIIYLIGSLTFIIGLKMLSHPESARKGNLVAAFGMTIAIFGTIFLYRDEEGHKLHNYIWIFAALIVGTLVGFLIAKKVQMTAMPEMVSLFNGMGGACAMLISILEFKHISDNAIVDTTSGQNGFMLIAGNTSHLHMLIIVVGMVIGAVSFAGSMIAWGKLNGKIKDLSYNGQTYVNLALLIGLVGLCTWYIFKTPVSGAELGGIGFTLTDGTVATQGLFPMQVYIFYGIIVLALVYGIMFVLPIGGADMPVVISLLNSFTGMAAAFGGFLYGNQVMLTGGILVGAAGTLLTLLMCKAMNRSLQNVLLGSFGSSAKATAGGSKEQGNYKEISLSDASTIMAYANKVMIVPGYGLAVAQAQHTCHELEKLLEERGVEVKYAIHPVAGRMPGHMNVLLAEADVSYEKLLEMEDANEEFKSTDVVLILGANDVVNPAAKNDPSSPIFGMPILEVETAKNVIVNKRSMKPGYAGIENDLFFAPKTSMLFGDAKAAIQKLVSEIKNV